MINKGNSIPDGVPVLNAFCPTGKGGGVDPSCSGKGKKGYSKIPNNVASVPVRDLYAGMTRTPAVKSKINELERGDFTYILNKPTEEAIQEIESVRLSHTESLNVLKKVGERKIELTGMDEKRWRSAEAKAGRIIPMEDWANKLAIPQKEVYLKSLDATENAIVWLAKKHSKRLTPKNGDDR